MLFESLLKALNASTQPISKHLPDPESMIALDPLIIAGIALISVGIIYTLVSARAGIVLVGLGTIAAGVFLFTIVPDWLSPFSVLFNGLLVVSGLWMVSVGRKQECAQR